MVWRSEALRPSYKDATAECKLWSSERWDNLIQAQWEGQLTNFGLLFPASAVLLVPRACAFEFWSWPCWALDRESMHPCTHAPMHPCYISFLCCWKQSSAVQKNSNRISDADSGRLVGSILTNYLLTLVRCTEYLVCIITYSLPNVTRMYDT